MSKVKFVLTSDLHYGFSASTEAKLRKFLKKLRKKITEEGDIKVLIVAGDIASDKPRQFKRCFEIIREYIDIPILAVRGNHDYWSKADSKSKFNFNHIEGIWKFHKQVFSDNDIHHLETGPFIIEDVIVCGFDGWYHKVNPKTNDRNYMPKFVKGAPIVMQYLSTKAHRDLDACLLIDKTSFHKRVMVTHHNSYPYNQWSSSNEMGANPLFLKEIKDDKFNVLCCGHTHKFIDMMDEELRILNSGSDYNQPKFLIFEV